MQQRVFTKKKTACKHIHSEEVGMEREYCLSRDNIAKHNLPYIWLEITARNAMIHGFDWKYGVQLFKTFSSKQQHRICNDPGPSTVVEEKHIQFER
jgi:hypothetical protein